MLAMYLLRLYNGEPLYETLYGSPLYNLNKSKANILKAYVKDENNNGKNSFTVSNYIRNISMEDDEIMVSFDITSLYTNIRIIDMLNLIKNYI